MSEKTKQPKKVVLLDLDGTLTKSDPGIIGCVVKVFEELGYPVPDDEELQRFIGPAIVESLQRNNIPDDLLDEGIAIYRRYYAQEAVFDDPNNPGQKVPGRLNNTIYDGIPEQLSKLRADGYYLAIASCKPQYQCIPICEHFHLDTMVNGIYGASEDNSRLDKDQVIQAPLLFFILSNDRLQSLIGGRIGIAFTILPRFRHWFPSIPDTMLPHHSQFPLAFNGQSKVHPLHQEGNNPATSDFQNRTVPKPVSAVWGQSQIPCEASTGSYFLCQYRTGDHVPQSAA